MKNSERSTTLRIGSLIGASLLWAGVVLAYSSNDALSYGIAAVTGGLLLATGLVLQLSPPS